MANRLTRIYTRTGDDGTTGLADGTRLPKDAARIEALGTVDELNAVIGRMLTHDLPGDVREVLDRVQHDLFEIGSELAVPGLQRLADVDVARLEGVLEHYNATLPPLKEFILPGGAPSAADAHVARTVCRRAERTLVGLGRDEATLDASRRYLNRLSDVLFVLSRVLNRAAGRADVYWQSAKLRSGGA